jgi:hypothetical protein
MKVIGSLFAALIVIVLVTMAQVHFHLPQAIALGVVMFLTMLITYPVWYGKRHEITFKRWMLVAAVASPIAAAVYFVVARLLGQ